MKYFFKILGNLVLVSILFLLTSCDSIEEEIEVTFSLNCFYSNSRLKTIPSEIERIDIYAFQLDASTENIWQQGSYGKEFFSEENDEISFTLPPGENIFFVMEAWGENLETPLYLGESGLYDFYPGQSVDVLIRMESLKIESDQFFISNDLLVEKPLEEERVFSPLAIRGRSGLISSKNRKKISAEFCKIVARIYNEDGDVLGFSSSPVGEDGSFEFNLDFFQQKEGSFLLLEITEIFKGNFVFSKTLNLIQHDINQFPAELIEK